MSLQQSLALYDLDVTVPFTIKGIANDTFDLRNVASAELHDPSAALLVPVAPAPPVAEIVSNVLVPPAVPFPSVAAPVPPLPTVTV
jgi:hypothetical protein